MRFLNWCVVIYFYEYLKDVAKGTYVFMSLLKFWSLRNLFCSGVEKLRNTRLRNTNQLLRLSYVRNTVCLWRTLWYFDICTRGICWEYIICTLALKCAPKNKDSFSILWLGYGRNERCFGIRFRTEKAISIIYSAFIPVLGFIQSLWR